jgi:hypothetical protein
VELGEPKTDRQMKKLEQDNRRVRRILKKLTEVSRSTACKNGTVLSAAKYGVIATYS